MDTHARVSVLEGWKATHKDEHEALWLKVNTAYDRSLSLEAKMAVYSAIGGCIGSVLGGVAVWLITKGTP